ncbi:MAG: sugar phosphate isomerase/epimerase family protein [Deinococcales bacterium]
MNEFVDCSRLSLNQYTTFNLNVKEAIDACLRADLHYICLWRDKIASYGLDNCAKIVKESGIKVSSICRGGMFPALSKEERQKRIDDNKRAIDECVALGTDTLVLVCGGLHNKNIEEARDYVEEGISAILPYVDGAGVKLGIEPLHPQFAADRSVMVSLPHAVSMAKAINQNFPQVKHPVGVVIDVYHVWWDPYVYEGIKAAQGLIYGFHVCDWITPLPDTLKGRGMMGDGHIDIRRLRLAVEAVGYHGPIECEIFNQALWDSDVDEVIDLMKQRFMEVC